MGRWAVKDASQRCLMSQDWDRTCCELLIWKFTRKKKCESSINSQSKMKKKCPHKRVPFYVHKAECTASVLETQSCLDGQNQKIINQTKANLLMLLYYIIWVVSLWLCQCPIGCNFIVTGFILHTYICTTFFSGGGGGHVFYSYKSIGKGQLQRVSFVDSVLYFYPFITWTLSSWRFLNFKGKIGKREGKSGFKYVIQLMCGLGHLPQHCFMPTAISKQVNTFILFAFFSALHFADSDQIYLG